MLKTKLSPGRFTDMSPKMAAIVGCIVGECWTSPGIIELSVTSDGFVTGFDTNHRSPFLGTYQELCDNWARLLDAAGLDDAERTEAEQKFAQRLDTRWLIEAPR